MSEGLDLDEIRRSAEPGAMFGAIIVRDLVERLEQAEARVKLLESGIVSEFVVTSVHSARAIGTAVSGISEALLKLGYDGLTERLEQAEQDRVKLRNRLDAMRRQRDGYQAQARKAEEAVSRVREMAEEMGEGKAFGILTRGREDEYPISYFIEMLEEALDGDTRE